MKTVVLIRTSNLQQFAGLKFLNQNSFSTSLRLASSLLYGTAEFTNQPEGNKLIVSKQNILYMYLPVLCTIKPGIAVP